MHVRLYSGETHNRLEMYLNRSDTHWRVASQGFQAVLDGMPKSVVSSSYRVSARYAQTAVYSRVLTRANNADRNWLLVTTDMDRLTSSANWYNTYEFEPGAAPRQLLLRRQPLTQAVPTEVDRRCNYLDCTNCATNELQTLCFVAQRCVMARCVGAVVNTNNVFCAVGILLREVLVLQGSEDGSVYVGVVEVFTTIVRQYFSPQNGVNTVALQSISNLYTTIDRISSFVVFCKLFYFRPISHPIFVARHPILVTRQCIMVRSSHCSCLLAHKTKLRKPPMLQACTARVAAPRHP